MTSSKLKTALVVGATGLIGETLTRRLLDSGYYERVCVLSRKPLTWQHPRLLTLPFDFDQPNSLLVRADAIFCCLGTTIKKAGSKAAFRRVDHDYPLTIARLGLANGAAQFAIVTSMGADPDSAIFYNKVKGEVERDLMALAYPTLLIFRPSILLGERTERRLVEQISSKIMQLAAPLMPAKYRPIEAEKVANAMLTTMQEPPTGTRILESDALQGY